MLSLEVFEDIKTFHKHILIVTKYWDKEKTLKIYNEALQRYPDIIFGLGENRIEAIKEKQLPRDKVHFIGNIQSQKIPDIVKYCATIHSLASFKHAKKIEAQWLSVRAFIQIQLDTTKPIGVNPQELPKLLEATKDFTHLKIIGISGMGAGEFSQAEKREEFQKLLSLRDAFLPGWIISAGTSRDYQLALKEWIDVVRVGSAICL